MQVIPVADAPAQTLSAFLGGQNVRIELRQRIGSLYCWVYVDDALIVGGVVCRDLTLIVRDAYLGFVGDLYWQDLQGAKDPSYPGLGTRWQLCYREA